ncbi:unnamed protein product [Larinioides sclopetarius]|uniref:Uncharacterized protein n=1 Tax=Larinioides sclopetarius TaxID=280406 RepID=A0AAV2BMQ4_9ARAC
MVDRNARHIPRVAFYKRWLLKWRPRVTRK